MFRPHDLACGRFSPTESHSPKLILMCCDFECLRIWFCLYWLYFDSFFKNTFFYYFLIRYNCVCIVYVHVSVGATETRGIGHPLAPTFELYRQLCAAWCECCALTPDPVQDQLVINCRAFSSLKHGFFFFFFSSVVGFLSVFSCLSGLSCYFPIFLSLLGAHTLCPSSVSMLDTSFFTRGFAGEGGGNCFGFFF